jgi:hypothetical protein
MGKFLKYTEQNTHEVFQEIAICFHACAAGRYSGKHELFAAGMESAAADYRFPELMRPETDLLVVQLCRPVDARRLIGNTVCSLDQ